MIITITANPSIDMTIDMPALTLNSVNRATTTRKDPAGKGINVSRALSANGVPTVAVFPSDSLSGEWLEHALEDQGVESMAMPIRDEVRTNVMITDDLGNTTTINGLGPVISSDERAAMMSAVESVLASQPDWLVGAGSLPRGLDGQFYVELGALATKHGVRYAVDTSGEALATAAHAGLAGFMKPNRYELEELAGVDLPTVGDVIDFCHGLLHEDAKVMVSLGANGAILVTAEGNYWAGHGPVQANSTVGAGDCTVAGFLAAERQCRAQDIGGAEANIFQLTTAVAWGCAAARTAGTVPPAPGDITPDRVRVVIHPERTTRIEDLTA